MASLLFDGEKLPSPTYDNKEELLEHVWRVLEKTKINVPDGTFAYCKMNILPTETFKQLHVSTDELDSFIRNKVRKHEVVKLLIMPIENMFVNSVGITLVTK